MNKKLTLGFTALALLGTSLAATSVMTVNAQTTKGGTIFDSGIINSFKTETVQVGEHTISYEIRKGKANPEKTYVLSHGATATGEFMKVVAAELAQKEPNARIIILDLPLHGNSTGPMDNLEDITVHTYADIMKDFLDIKTADGTVKGDVSWVGWSMGGAIGMLLDLNGAKIDELTLLNSGSYFGPIEGLIEMLPAEVIKEVFYHVIEPQLYEFVTEKEREDILNHYNKLTTESAELMAQDFVAVSPKNYDIREKLKEIEAKTLIISGTKDIVALPTDQELMNQEITGSKLVMFEDDHVQLVKPTQAKKIVSEMEQFFK